jgi:hypothetical protein
MTVLLLVALGGALGASLTIFWLAREAPPWVWVASNSAVCGLMGAFAAAAPNGSGPLSAVLYYGLLSTAATPLSALFPLPQIRDYAECRKVVKRMTSLLAASTVYGTTCAVVGNALVQSIITLIFKSGY